jgi:hypothetical protein
VDLLVEGIEDRGLDGPVEELVGVAAEELVERVVAGHVDREPAPAAARASPHLPQRGDRPRERDADRGVERADVDAQLERVRRDDAEQVAVDEALLELAPLLRRVARAIWRDPVAQVAAPELLERELRELRDQLHRLARLHEDDRPRALRHELREQVRGLGQRRAARLQLLVGHGRVPHRDRLARARRAVAVHDRHLVQPRQPLGELTRVRDRGARQQEARLGPVGRGHPPEPPQHVGDVGAEDAAVDVRLVDDDDREVGEHVRPGPVVREDPEVQHVRVREDHVRLAADLGALLARRVAVVDRGPHAGHAERRERARLVLRERLGRVEVERPRVAVAAQRVERRQLEAERLAARRAGGDDGRARPGRVQRLGLMRPEPLDAARLERSDHRGVQRLRERDRPRLAAVLRGLPDQAVILAPGGEQLVPGLDVTDDGHQGAD